MKERKTVLMKISMAQL